MSEPEALETVLADMFESLRELERNHVTLIAPTLLEAFAKRVKDASEDFVVFLPEKEAALWSGRSKVWLRAHYPALERLGHAKKRDHGRGDRTYRRCILPRRADTAAARADAARTARAQNQ
ncbi:MAG: hypothetical protein JWL97_2999 [Gemmatimonadales bacterium]|nr:hypothetical protein [Gemmatimonadales bacterium]